MNDSDAPAPVKVTIDWFRSTPWWRIASHSIVISWRSTHVLLCAAALLLTQCWLWICQTVFSAEGSRDWLWPSGVNSTRAASWTGSDFVVGDSPIWVWRQFLTPMSLWLQSPSLNGAADAIASLIGIVAIWSFIGGCLSRRSVLEMGANITAPWAETFRLVLKRWQSIAWSVTMPSGLILIISVVPLILGWISNVPYLGPWCAGLLLIPMVLASLGIGWCAAITVLGFPLSVCSIVTEKQADAFDGISRPAAYVFQRPLTLGLCVVAAEFMSVIGGTTFSLVVHTGFSMVLAAFDVGSVSNFSKLETVWTPLIHGIPILIVTAYGYSFFWTAASATYLVLRKDVDQAEFDLIDLDNSAPAKVLPELPKMKESPSEKSLNPVAQAEEPSL